VANVIFLVPQKEFDEAIPLRCSRFNSDQAIRYAHVVSQDASVADGRADNGNDYRSLWKLTAHGKPLIIQGLSVRCDKPTFPGKIANLDEWVFAVEVSRIITRTRREPSPEAPTVISQRNPSPSLWQFRQICFGLGD